MIEKLDEEHRYFDCDVRVVKKLNEVIDVVNVLTECNKVTGETLNDLLGAVKLMGKKLDLISDKVLPKYYGN